ncbi:hypothetical protein [Legionella hackeliae]|uniref:Coiled-coil protein n=1 Tax=Legionella hackeliae TaxID=449 RepID=A0A0A8ULN8_LEGHA|nr:hypothetical protein [Legionella hackeliae]KTD10124.1 coiled-coil protein [Legionella hackeliae]CEK09613.1 conserved protein of unknown function [Legionella hackeliae]STX49528.1 coiled-coil protein [Legionella hackeliae]
MGKKDANTRIVHGNNKTKQPYSNQETQLFFNQKQKPSSTEVQPFKEIQPPAQEIKIETTTDLLLVAILEELKTHNMIELMKLKTQQEQEEKELQATQNRQAQDNTRFEEIRSTMYL